MPITHLRAILAHDVLSGRRREVPWHELASNEFLAQSERGSWEIFEAWAAEHHIAWRIQPSSAVRDGVWIKFMTHVNEPVPADISSPETAEG